MRRIYTALVAASMLIGGGAAQAQNRDGYRNNNTVQQIRSNQREAKARKEAERRQFERERAQRFEAADRYHQQQRVKEDRQRQERQAYNRERRDRINRLRNDPRNGRDATEDRNRNIRQY